MTTFINLHILQPFSFANPNRDDVGAPKHLFYGGEMRSRISSQSWKRAIRLATEAELDATTFRAAPTYLAPKLAERIAARVEGADEAAAFKAAFIAAQQLTTKDLDLKTAHAAWKKHVAVGGEGEESGSDDREKKETLVWVSGEDLDRMADAIAGQWAEIEPLCTKASGQDGPKVVERALDGLGTMASVATIAAFGRMMSNDVSWNVDAAVQVAHAFTTHPANQQVDYFTAVDDLTTSQGAGHLNLGQFTGGVYYRYLSFDLDQLEANLGRRDAAVLRTLLAQAVLALPSGKQNSTANHEAPLMVLGEVGDRALSYAQAFETPLATRGASSASASALLAHAAKVERMLPGAAAARGLVSLDRVELGELDAVEHASLRDLVSQLVSPWA